MQEEDVIGVLNSKDIAQLLPLGDRILVEVSKLSKGSAHVAPKNARLFVPLAACLCIPFEQVCFALQIADVEDTTEGGLLMAGSSKEKPTLGTVRCAQVYDCACYIQPDYICLVELVHCH